MIRACYGLLVDALFFADPLEQILGNELAELLGYSDVDISLLAFLKPGIESNPIFIHYGIVGLSPNGRLN